MGHNPTDDYSESVASRKAIAWVEHPILRNRCMPYNLSMSTQTIIIIVVLVVLFSGGGYYFRG